MKKQVVIFILLLTSCMCRAQIDSSYIRPFEHRLSVRPYVAKTLLFMSQEFESGDEISYMANNPPKIGLGFSLNNTVISFGYGYGFDFMRDKKYGKTETLDFQLHNYGRKFVFDIYFQRYKGLYDAEDENNIKLYPDMELRQYGAYGLYVFNNKRYSYIAAYNQDEKQLKSTGSFLVGASIYDTRITSDSSFVHNGKNSFRNFQFGISAGYAYTWVLGRYWDISASATTGINFGSEKFSNFGKKLEVYPTVFPRISAGYNKKSWSLGFSYLGNMVFPVMSDEESIAIHTGSFQISFVKRFDIIPVVGNKADRLLRHF